ncbi:MAG: BON domain-containing protein [Methylovulum sp.]|nr:BON domain-containing protein [Methylovulum sp.]
MKTTHKSQHNTLTDHWLIIALLSVGLGLAGCQQEGPAEKAGQKIDKAAEKVGAKIDDAKTSVNDQAEIAEDYIDDAMITLNVKTAIANDSILKVFHIDVTTVEGVVTLSGAVDSESSLGRAMEVANSQKHVKSVQTKLSIDAQPQGK